MKVAYIIILFLSYNYIYSQTNIDDNWEIGSNWEVNITVYRSFYGKPHQPSGPYTKPWKEEWDSIKKIPLVNCYVDISIIDTNTVNLNNCWVFEFFSDTSGRNQPRAALNAQIVRSIKNPAYSWIDQETLEMIKGERKYEEKGPKYYIDTSKYDDYYLPSYPLQGHFPSFISLLIVKEPFKEDSIRLIRDSSILNPNFKFIEQKIDSTSNGVEFYVKYVKNQGRKKGEYKSPGYFDREIYIYWKKGKSWWSWFEYYIDGDLKMEAYLIE